MTNNDQIAKIIGDEPQGYTPDGVTIYATQNFNKDFRPVYPDYTTNTDAALRVLAWMNTQTFDYWLLTFEDDRAVCKNDAADEFKRRDFYDDTPCAAIMAAFEWFCKARRLV